MQYFLISKDHFHDKIFIYLFKLNEAFRAMGFEIV